VSNLSREEAYSLYISIAVIESDFVFVTLLRGSET
jgi:hypothetical protein